MSNTKAKKLLKQAIDLEDHGEIENAIKLYTEVISLDPTWSVPHYNVGLIYKYQGEWQKSYEYNKQAIKLDPDEESAWWNLGIAATVLLDWRTARQAWNKFKLNFEVNDEPLDLDLGNIPIRLNPETDGEVVWCKRVDPARAVIYNIPLPGSEHRYGDLVLNDGAPVGYRTNNGTEYPVLNELQLLSKSSYKTYSIIAEVESQSDIDKLETLCKDQNVEMEDWSTIRLLCKQCSEGNPHEHHDKELEDVNKNQRHIGFASLSDETLKHVLANWRLICLREHSVVKLELE
jgi:tetratricopeptide (TPR) repeat protein